MNGASKLVSGLAVLLFSAGLAVAGVATHAIRLVPGPDASATVPSGVSATAPSGVSTAAPHQARPAGIRTLAWSVPVRVIIPAISVNAPVTEVGLNQDRTVQTPPLNDHNLAGWYKYSVTPGQTGSSVVVGHVDSYTGPSVFFRLKELHKGDTVQVKRADGHLVIFTVDGVQVASKTAFPTEAVYRNTGYPSLRLVTCGGPFDYSTGHYLDNIVVYAHLLRTA
jgi:LPXTG-site transpeptidase (sortase) family protein